LSFFYGRIIYALDTPPSVLFPRILEMVGDEDDLVEYHEEEVIGVCILKQCWMIKGELN